MSLPPAKRDISEHPAAGTVTDPVNTSAKNADIDRKIRFYGVISAFREGRMPSNDQIVETLDYVLANSPVDLSKLSPEGRSLVQDTRHIINTSKTIVQEKNADELFQSFVWHTRDVSKDKSVPTEGNNLVPVDKEKVSRDSDAAAHHLRTLLSLFLTNSEVRKLISDFSVIGRDLLAISASKASEQLRPSEDKLSSVDDPAPQDQFITQGGRVAGPGETPVLEARVPGTDHRVVQHPHEELGTGAKLKTQSGEERRGNEVAEEARTLAEQKKDEARFRAKAETQRHTEDLREAVEDPQGDPQAEATAQKQSLRDRFRGYRDNLLDRVPQEHKDNVNDQTDRTKRFLLDEYFPEERRDQFIWRGKKVVIECQKHKDYQESMRWLIKAVEEYVGHARRAGEEGAAGGKQLTEDATLNTSLRELRTLLERFANNQTMDGIFDAVNVLVDDTRRDPELRNWFKSVNFFMKKVLLEPGFIVEDDCDRGAQELRESGRMFYDVKYKAHFDNLFEQTGRWFGAMGEDPLNKQLGDDFARLTKNLLFDNEGALKFKPHLWQDIRTIIVPSLVDKAGYIPIPRIEYTDDKLDLVLENLTLSGRNILPNIFEMEMRNYFKISPYNAIQDDQHHEMYFEATQMQVDMRDVAFWYRKKGGAGPNMTDSGLADVVLGGEGLKVDVWLKSADKRDKRSVVKVKDVKVKVDTLKFKIRDSQHDLLYKIFGTLATGLVKKQIQKAIADGIRTGVEYVDGQLVTVRDRMNEAKYDDQQTRAQALQDLFKREQAEAESMKSTASQKNMQFKVVANKKDSIVDSNAGHPEGWVNKMMHKEEQAARGREWKSDAFTIVPKTTSGHGRQSVRPTQPM